MTEVHTHIPRIFSRIEANLSVTGTLHAPEPGDRAPEFSARLHDASLNGVGLVVQEELPENARVALSIQVDHRPPYRLQGLVRWTRFDESKNAFISGILLDPEPYEVMREWRNLFHDGTIAQDADSLEEGD